MVIKKSKHKFFISGIQVSEPNIVPFLDTTNLLKNLFMGSFKRNYDSNLSKSETTERAAPAKST